MGRQFATRAAAGAAALLVTGCLFLLFVSATPPAEKVHQGSHATTSGRAALVASGTVQYRPEQTGQ